MGTPAKTSDKKKERKERETHSDHFDEELEESFPASDPPASIQPLPPDRKPPRSK